MPVTARRFREADTHPVHNLIIRNFLEVNVKDYGLAAMQQLAATYTEEKVRALAKSAHMYVFETGRQIVGTGSIAPFLRGRLSSFLWPFSFLFSLFGYATIRLNRTGNPCAHRKGDNPS